MPVQHMFTRGSRCPAGDNAVRGTRRGFYLGAACATLVQLLGVGQFWPAAMWLLVLAAVAGAMVAGHLLGRWLDTWWAARRATQEQRDTIARIPLLLNVSPALREQLLLAEIRDML